jgi:hypothetical protein
MLRRRTQLQQYGDQGEHIMSHESKSSPFDTMFRFQIPLNSHHLAMSNSLSTDWIFTTWTV